MTAIEQQIVIHNLSASGLSEMQSAEINKLVAELKTLTKELNNIDAVLARRPALDDCKTRTDKIEKAISTARQIDTLTASLAEVTKMVENRDRLAVEDGNKLVKALVEREAFREQVTTLEAANKGLREAIENIFKPECDCEDRDIQGTITGYSFHVNSSITRILKEALTTTPNLEAGRNALRTAIGMSEFNPPATPTPNAERTDGEEWKLLAADHFFKHYQSGAGREAVISLIEESCKIGQDAINAEKGQNK